MKIKETKRQEAEQRETEYKKMPIKERIRKLDEGGYVATKERRKKGYPELKKKGGEHFSG